MRRRRFVTTAGLAGLVAALIPGRLLAAPPPLRPLGLPLRIRRLASGHYLVNGWVLTAADLEALNLSRPAHDR